MMSQNQASSNSPSSQGELNGAKIDQIFSEMGQCSKRPSLRLLFYFLRPRWGFHLLTFIVSLVVAFCETLNVGLILPMLITMFNVSATGVGGGRLVAWLNYAIARVPIEDRVVGASLLLISIALLKSLLSLLGEYMASYLGSKITHKTKMELLEKYCRFPYPFFLEHKQAHLRHIVVHSTLRLSLSLSMIPTWITEFLKIVAVLMLLLFVNAQVTFMMIGISLAFYFLFGYITRQFSYTVGRSFSNCQIEQANLVDEILSGMKHIFVYRVFSYWFERFSKSSKSQVNYQIKQALLASIPKNLLELVIMTVFFGGIISMRLLSPNGYLQYIPLMGLLGMALMRVIPSLQMLTRIRLGLMELLPDIEMVYQVLTAKVQEARYGKRILSSFDCAITFDNVHFDYANNSEGTLNGVSASFERNNVTAIVGCSGAGKTTLINLLVGLYEPGRGSIKVDSNDLRDCDINSWRAQIGFVSQDPFIFHGTIAENIAFGDDRFSREQIIEAACVANAHEFITKQPQGYETVVGERGMKLSGGQQQRIAIARAVLRNPEILIFDEATSALDSFSEKLVQESIGWISRNRTVLLIAHRLSTVQNADKIIVLHGGRCVEEGKHDELMRNNGMYSRLIQSQSPGDSGTETATQVA